MGNETSKTDNRGMIACESCGYEPDTVEEYLAIDPEMTLDCPRCKTHNMTVFMVDSLEMIKTKLETITTLTSDVDALAKRCGFPACNDYSQMLETIGNKVERLTASSAKLRELLDKVSYQSGLFDWMCMNLDDGEELIDEITAALAEKGGA